MTNPTPRFPNKLARERAELLRSFGYIFSHWSAGHAVFTHAEQPPFHLACTVHTYGKAGAAFDLEMKRRHNYIPPGRNRKPGRRRNRKAEADRRAAQLSHQLRANAERVERAKPAPVVRLPYTGCVKCGYRWLSDLDPTGRPCPKCDGEITPACERKAA